MFTTLIYSDLLKSGSADENNSKKFSFGIRKVIVGIVIIADLQSAKLIIVTLAITHTFFQILKILSIIDVTYNL